MGDSEKKTTTSSKGLLKNEELYQVYISAGTPSSMNSSSLYSLMP